MRRPAQPKHTLQYYRPAGDLGSLDNRVTLHSVVGDFGGQHRAIQRVTLGATDRVMADRRSCKVGGVVGGTVPVVGHGRPSGRCMPTARIAPVYISAKADYAARALLTLAAAGGGPLKGEVLAREQGLPKKFLENTLVTLRRAGVLETQRGSEGGYRLARPADQITIADIMRPLDGPLAEVRGEKPEEAVYDGAAAHLRDVWVAVRAALRDVLELVTLADVVAGELPPHVQELLDRPGAWERRAVAATVALSAPPAPTSATAGARQLRQVRRASTPGRRPPR